MKTLLVCLALICVSALCVSAAAPEQEDGVYVLTTSNFDEFVNEQDFTVVEFYAPWCGHCKKLTPEYAEAAQALAKNSPPIKIAKVDATIESELGTRFGVSGYPTLKIFRKGTASEYKGPRDASGIISYITKQSSPAITLLKAKDDLEKFLAKGAAIVYYGAKGSALYKAFEAVSGKLRENFRFAHAEDFGDHKDKVVLLQSRQYTQSPLETKEYIFDKSSEHDLTEFIHNNFLPLVGEYHEDVDALYRKKNLPLVKLYTDVDWEKNSKGINYIANRVRKIASEFKDKFTFALAHKSKHQKEIDDTGLKTASPFAIHDLAKGHKFPALASFTPEALKTFLNEYLEGKHEPYIKSEPVPTQVAGEPVVVVGKNFDEIVNDPTKDVLLEAYAPWCGHCKSLDPKYKELAKKMSKYSDTLTIAKVDATANDLPPNFAVSGFPTIFFVPANAKSSPMKYDSAREVKDFVSYIKRNAHNKPWEKSGNKDEL